MIRLMAYFNDIQTFYDCISDLFDRLAQDPDIRENASSRSSTSAETGQAGKEKAGG